MIYKKNEMMNGSTHHDWIYFRSMDHLEEFSNDPRFKGKILFSGTPKEMYTAYKEYWDKIKSGYLKILDTMNKLHSDEFLRLIPPSFGIQKGTYVTYSYNIHDVGLFERSNSLVEKYGKNSSIGLVTIEDNNGLKFLWDDKDIPAKRYYCLVRGQYKGNECLFMFIVIKRYKIQPEKFLVIVNPEPVIQKHSLIEKYEIDRLGTDLTTEEDDKFQELFSEELGKYENDIELAFRDERYVPDELTIDKMAEHVFSQNTTMLLPITNNYIRDGPLILTPFTAKVINNMFNLISDEQKNWVRYRDTVSVWDISVRFLLKYGFLNPSRKDKR